MKVFRVVKQCSISYVMPKEHLDGLHDANDFALFPGDMFFIEEAGWNLTDNHKFYSKVYKLTKIYYHKLIDMRTGEKEWTWINDINLIKPRLNKHFLFEPNAPVGADHPLEDVTTMWNREDKLIELGI